MKRKALGKGLSALLPESLPPEKGDIVNLAVDKLLPNPLQPRSHFAEDKLQELADSIKEKGILQPLIVMKGKEDSWYIVVGERRWRAARLAGLKEVPVLISELAPMESVELALVENLQREDLNPIEEAYALNFLLGEQKITQEELSRRLGRARPSIANAVRLLALEPEMQQDLIEGCLTPGHARAALTVPEENPRREFWQFIKAHNCSVRQAEKLAKNFAGQSGSKAGTVRLSPQLLSVKEEISEQLGQKIDFRFLRGGKGKIMISFGSEEEFSAIIDYLLGRRRRASGLEVSLL